MTAVNISPEWRQNQILRASLQLNPNIQQSTGKQKRQNSLLNVEYEIKHTRCDAQASKV
jgi:hypothetical protein